MNELIASIKTNQKLWDADESAMLDICNTLIMQQSEIEAYKNLVKAQDEKIVELAFRAVYAERGNEVVKELNNGQ